jgi:hypothetical protein
MMMGEKSGQGPDYEAARMRLHGELQIVGVERFPQTALMVRDTPSIGSEEVLRQSQGAIREISERLDELAAKPLLPFFGVQT